MVLEERLERNKTYKIVKAEKGRIGKDKESMGQERGTKVSSCGSKQERPLIS
jgi:hypothetical protein